MPNIIQELIADIDEAIYGPPRPGEPRVIAGSEAAAEGRAGGAVLEAG